jgi:hypothetical protein
VKSQGPLAETQNWVEVEFKREPPFAEARIIGRCTVLGRLVLQSPQIIGSNNGPTKRACAFHLTKHKKATFLRIIEELAYDGER